MFLLCVKKIESVRNLDQGTRGRRKGLYISEGFIFFTNDIRNVFERAISLIEKL